MPPSAPASCAFARHAYLFVDGVNVKVRLGEDPKVCLEFTNRAAK